MAKKKELSKIKSSLVSRSLSIAKISLSAGTRLAAQGIGSALKSKDAKSQSWNEFVKSQARILTTELGELKGSLMKAGQMLSVYAEHFFPPEVAQILRALQQDSPPVKWEEMDKILSRHLGVETKKLLEIEKESIGTASLGQVHRAKIKSTGDVIALKIQYPKVDEAIDSDLKALKTMLGVMKILPKDFDTTPIFKEIRQMLLQETDYIKEADSTEEYYRLLKGDPRFVVPKVYRDFSNKRVIATSFETGLRVDDPTIKNLSQDRRNRIALNFMELYFKEIFQWKFVQTDPHFGNYRIRLHQKGEDQIVLFDFGATRQYPDSFMGPYHRMIKAMFYNNDEDFEKAAHDLKLLQKGDTPELVHVFKELCFDIVEPFLLPDDPRNKVGRVEADGTYDWKKTDLPQRSTRKVKTMLADFQWRTPPREFIFLDRKAAGVFIFLSHLGAKIQGRELLEKYLKQV